MNLLMNYLQKAQNISARLLIFCLSITFCQPSFSQSFEDKIDSLFQFYNNEKPGGQLAVSQNGKVIYSKVWGISNLETETLISKESLIEAGSVSKQFTAAAILILEDQGMLSLDDPISKYVSGLPSYGSKIRIRQLIHHTSGLREWSDIAELAGWPVVLAIPDNQSVIDMIRRQKSLNSEPGEMYNYSNSNYILLAQIVEKVSGLSLADFTKKQIFDPAGMTHTQWRTDYHRVVPNRTYAYEVTNGEFKLSMPENNIYGPGGLLTTAEDLTKWNDFYGGGKLGSKLKTKQIACDTLNNGEVNNYAAGLFISGNGVGQTFQHAGATAGYRAKLIYSPSQQLSVAWLSNTSMLDTTGFDPAMEVFQILSKSDSSPDDKEPSIVTDVKKLKSYAGLYKSGQSSRDVEITLGADGLLLSETILKPLNEAQFRFYNFTLSFDGQGRLIIAPPFSDLMRYHISSVEDKRELDEYVGKYFSLEVGAEIEVRKRDDQIELQLVSGPAHVMQPFYADGFLVGSIKADVFFKRSKKNKIQSLELSTARSWNMEFKKMP